MGAPDSGSKGDGAVAGLELEAAEVRFRGFALGFFVTGWGAVANVGEANSAADASKKMSILFQ